MSAWLAFTMGFAGAATFLVVHARFRILPSTADIPSLDHLHEKETYALYRRIREWIPILRGLALACAIAQVIVFISVVRLVVTDKIPFASVGGPWPWWIANLLCLTVALFIDAACNDLRELQKGAEVGIRKS